MPCGIILAGGRASRIGENKLLLPYKNKTIIQAVIETMRPHVTSIIVVTGCYHEALKKALKHESNVKVVHNQAYEQGMFTSVLKGIENINDDFFLTPGDIPSIKSTTYKYLLSVHSDKHILVPSYNGRNGHPIFIKQSLISPLLQEASSSNLKRFRNQQGYETIPVDDEGVLIDIDTFEDYAKLNNF